jgi:hypothetical protein
LVDNGVSAQLVGVSAQLVVSHGSFPYLSSRGGRYNVSNNIIDIKSVSLFQFLNINKLHVRSAQVLIA